MRGASTIWLLAWPLLVWPAPAAAQPDDQVESPWREPRPEASKAAAVRRLSGTPRLELPPAAPSGSAADASPTGAFVTTGGALAIVAGCLLVLLWLGRKHGGAGPRTLPEGIIELLGQRRLDGKHHLRLLRFGERLLLVAVSASSVSTLCEIDDPDEARRLLGDGDEERRAESGERRASESSAGSSARQRESVSGRQAARLARVERFEPPMAKPQTAGGGARG